MTAIRSFFASRTGRLVLHDAALGAAAGVTFVETSHTVTWAVIVAAGAIALKVFLRLLLPAAPDAKPKADAGMGAIDALIVVFIAVIILVVLLKFVG